MKNIYYFFFPKIKIKMIEEIIEIKKNNLLFSEYTKYVENKHIDELKILYFRTNR